MKLFLKITLGIFLIVVSILFYYFTPKPWVVTDPSDPRFQAEDFRFENYTYTYRETKMDDVMREMFPVGTSKEFVENILVEEAGARFGRSSTNSVSYLYDPETVYNFFSYNLPTTWNVNVKYSPENKVEQIYVSGFGAVHINQSEME